MAKIHTIHANGSLPKPTLWHKMHNYFTLVKNEIHPRYKGLGGCKAATVSAAAVCSLVPVLLALPACSPYKRFRGQGLGWGQELPWQLLWSQLLGLCLQAELGRLITS